VDEITTRGELGTAPVDIIMKSFRNVNHIVKIRHKNGYKTGVPMSNDTQSANGRGKEEEHSQVYFPS
jgi:hypothetical protein